MPGKKKMPVEAYLRGNKFPEKIILWQGDGGTVIKWRGDRTSQCRDELLMPQNNIMNWWYYEY
jgi:hypothetical protein